MVHYIDTSAFVKLIVAEENSTELLSWIHASNPEFVSSDLLKIEALRSARRAGPSALKASREALRAVNLIAVSSDVCEVAADLDPAILRSLDAVHLATALVVGDDLAGVVTYDHRLSDACAVLGLAVIAPGHSST